MIYIIMFQAFTTKKICHMTNKIILRTLLTVQSGGKLMRVELGYQVKLHEEIAMAKFQCFTCYAMQHAFL